MLPGTFKSWSVILQRTPLLPSASEQHQNLYVSLSLLATLSELFYILARQCYLSFVSGERTVTSSVYNVHLAREILHRVFELGNATIFQYDELHRFWTDSLREIIWELYSTERS